MTEARASHVRQYLALMLTDTGEKTEQPWERAMPSCSPAAEPAAVGHANQDGDGVRRLSRFRLRRQRCLLAR